MILPFTPASPSCSRTRGPRSTPCSGWAWQRNHSRRGIVGLRIRQIRRCRLTGVEQDGQNGQREPWMTGWLGHVTSDDGLQGDRGALPQQLSRLAPPNNVTHLFERPTAETRMLVHARIQSLNRSIRFCCIFATGMQPASRHPTSPAMIETCCGCCCRIWTLASAVPLWLATKR